MSSRTRATFCCIECGHSAPKWQGQCAGCGEWNTVVEEPDNAVGGGDMAIGVPAQAAQPIAEVALELSVSVSTGLAEFDRVLGGGFTPSSVTLVGGEPGVGKSTLLLQALAGAASAGHSSLYVSAEESMAQIRRRAERLGVVVPELRVGGGTELPTVLGHLNDNRPAVMVVDSIQAIFDPQLSSAPGSVSQVRHCSHQLASVSREVGTALVLVGHVTKDGGIAGPRTLEHLVDTVLQFEGDRHQDLRVLRALKHRYGSTDEVGLMAMAEVGLEPVPDPSRRFLADRRAGAPGSAVTAILDGRRAVLVEVQALLAAGGSIKPGRSVHGIDSSRLAMVLAVLSRHIGLDLVGREVFTLAVGGAKVVDRAADLALAVAVASSFGDRRLAPDVVFIGEVGLGGELRTVPGMELRLAEAARLGFAAAVVPTSTAPTDAAIDVQRACSVDDALDLV